jgi:hypothetical protein
MSKTYTPENPPKSGNALKAWNYLTRKNFWFPGRPPEELFFAKQYDGDLRDVWVGGWGYIQGAYESGETMSCTVEAWTLRLMNMDGTDNGELICEVRDLALKQKEECAKKCTD